MSTDWLLGLGHFVLFFVILTILSVPGRLLYEKVIIKTDYIFFLVPFTSGKFLLSRFALV